MPDEMTEQPPTPAEPDFSWRTLFRQAPRGLRWSVYVAAALALLMVALCVTAAAFVRRPLPDTDGELELAGLDADGRGDPRRPRHRPDLCRHRRRPDARAGLRRRAGPVLRDGRASPRHGGAPLRAVRRRAVSRPTSTSARWGGAASPSRSGRCSRPRPATPSPPTPRASTPTSTENGHHRDRGRVHPARAAGARLRPGAVAARRLAGLAQGDGVGPARQHGRRDRARHGQPRPHARGDRRALPGLRPRGAPADRRHRRRRGRGVRAERDRQLHPQPAPSGVQRRDRPSPGRPPGGAGAAARAARSRRRHRLQLLGGRRRAQLDRSAAAGQRPAPRDQPARHLDADRAALSRDHQRLHPRRLRLHVLRRARRDHRPQRRHRLGLHQPRSRRHRPLPRADRGRRAGSRTARPSRSTLRTETIKVRGGDDFDLQIRETAHGPLLSDVSHGAEHRRRQRADRDDQPGDRGNGYAVALQWTALQPTTTADAVLGLNRASNWDEFRAAASDFAVPAQNMVYADREGHIGYQAPGLVPIRKSGNDGAMPAEGWLSANDWTGDYIPFDGLPNVLDPEEGFIVTANQAVIDDDYPYFLTDDWDYGYRSTRIRELLEAEGELSVEEMTRLQLDTANPMAATLVPYLLDIEDLGSAYYRDGQELLRGLGLHAAGGQRGGGLLQRRVEQPAAPDLPRRPARGHLAQRRRPLVRGGHQPAPRPGRTVVGRQRDRGRRRVARRHPAPGDARRPRRADQAAGARPGGVDVGRTCTRSTCTARRWASRASRRSSGSSTATATGVGGGVEHRRRDQLGRRPGLRA